MTDQSQPRRAHGDNPWYVMMLAAVIVALLIVFMQRQDARRKLIWHQERLFERYGRITGECVFESLFTSSEHCSGTISDEGKPVVPVVYECTWERCEFTCR